MTQCKWFKVYPTILWLVGIASLVNAAMYFFPTLFSLVGQGAPGWYFVLMIIFSFWWFFIAGYLCFVGVLAMSEPKEKKWKDFALTIFLGLVQYYVPLIMLTVWFTVVMFIYIFATEIIVVR